MTRERYLVSESCKTCKKPVYADEGYHSVSGEHYDCHQRDRDEFTKVADRLDQILGSKRQVSRRGDGASVARLKQMIEAALKAKFETDDVQDIAIYLTSPTWCRDTYDVHRFEGSARVDGFLRSFGSWATVTDCLKYREVKFNDEWPCMDLSPAVETKRGRKAAN